MTPLTIGTATFDDLMGTWFTVESLLLHHGDDLPGCEILVIDNQPGSPVSGGLKSLVGWAGQVSGISARYVPAGEIVGTSYPRDRVFREAGRDAVLCLDSHVLLAPGAIQTLRRFYAEHPECHDLLAGPMLDDRRQVCATHFDDVWSRNMWGVWGRDPRGQDPANPPFEIGAMGLGLFSCRQTAWPGFHPQQRGFGGEEWYIHEKFRALGRRCLCLPGLRWLHYFGPPCGGRKYPLHQWDRVRNYVLEHQELGLPLDRAHRHFVLGEVETRPDGTPADGPTTTLSQAQWDSLVADPTNLRQPGPQSRKRSPCGDCRQRGPRTATKPQAPDPQNLEEWYGLLCRYPSDINEHLPKLRALAAQCDTVIEFGVRTARSSVALLAGQPKLLKSYDRRRTEHVDQLAKWAGRTDYQFRQQDVLEAGAESCDLLFIDTYHTADQVRAELERHAGAVRRWIALHDTHTFGERGEDGGPGLLVGLRAFLREHPEWGVIYRAENNHGLMVLSRVDKRSLPPLARRAVTFLRHSWAHVRDGGADVTESQWEQRLDLCALCPSRADHHCAECGCPIEQKARWRSSVCELGRWPLPEPEA